MTIKMYQAFQLGNVLDKLISQQLAYPLSVAYRLYKVLNNVNQAEDFALKRIEMVMGHEISFEDMNENEKKLYAMVMDSDIDIELEVFTEEEIITDGASLTVEDVSVLDNNLIKKQ